MQALEAVRGAQSGPVGLGERVELGGGREAPLKHVDCLGELLVPARRDLGQALLRLSEPGGPEDGGEAIQAGRERYGADLEVALGGREAVPKARRSSPPQGRV